MHIKKTSTKTQPPFKKILFIYDEKTTAEMYQQRLERIHYHVFISRIDKNILKKTDIIKPHLIIISQVTPDNTCFNTIALLRRHTEYDRTPIIMLHNEITNEINEKSFSAGCSEVFDLNITFSTLASNLNDYFTLYPLLANKELTNNTVAIYELMAILQAKLPNNMSFTLAIKENLINSLNEIVLGIRNELSQQEKEKLAPLISGLPESAYTTALILLHRTL